MPRYEQRVHSQCSNPSRFVFLLEWLRLSRRCAGLLLRHSSITGAYGSISNWRVIGKNVHGGAWVENLSQKKLESYSLNKAGETVAFFFAEGRVGDITLLFAALRSCPGRSHSRSEMVGFSSEAC